MTQTLQSFLTSLQNNQTILLLFSGGILWTLLSNIRSIFETIWGMILACISFTVNSVNSSEYDAPLFMFKMTKVLSESKVLWERHTELTTSSNDYADNHLQNSAYGRSYRWLFGHFMILDRTYSMQSTKVVVTTTARVFFANRKKFIKRLMDEIEKCSLTKNRDTISVSMGKGIITEKPKRTIDSIYSNDGTPQKILEDIRAFIANRDIYVNGNSPYKFVALLSGKPGTGKTSAIHAIASELGMGIRFVNTDDEEFEDLARMMVRNGEYSGENSKNIIVIEDVDCMAMNATENRNLDDGEEDEDDAEMLNFCKIDDGDSTGTIMHKEEMKKAIKSIPSRKKSGNSSRSGIGFNSTTISLSSILNLLDGIVTPSGAIVFLTSNNPEKLDSALLRDGRIDSRYEFDNFTGKTANALVKDYLGFEIDNIKDIVSPSSLQRDVLKVRIGRMTKEALVEKYSNS